MYYTTESYLFPMVEEEIGEITGKMKAFLRILEVVRPSRFLTNALRWCGLGRPMQDREKIINSIMGGVRSYDNGGGLMPLGAALHTLGDTYAPSHTARDKGLNITRYQDYNAQNSKKHKEGDQKDKNLKQYQEAVNALTDFLNDVCDKSCSLEDIADNLRNGPLRHSIEVKVGGSHKDYK